MQLDLNDARRRLGQMHSLRGLLQIPCIYGRQAEADTVLDALANGCDVAIEGESGVGKSSLANLVSFRVPDVLGARWTTAYINALDPEDEVHANVAETWADATGPMVMVIDEATNLLQPEYADTLALLYSIKRAQFRLVLVSFDYLPVGCAHNLVRLELAPWSPEMVRDFVTERLGDGVMSESEIQCVIDASGGRPIHVVEVAVRILEQRLAH